jgi:hypothetical protein
MGLKVGLVCDRSDNGRRLLKSFYLEKKKLFGGNFFHEMFLVAGFAIRHSF